MPATSPPRPSPIKRTYSSQFGTNEDDYESLNLQRNNNTSWMASRGVFLTYTVLILFFHIAISANVVYRQGSTYQHLGWTITNVSHFFFTFLGMHWIKGSPNHYGQGEFSHLTWFEQLAANHDHYTDLVKNGLLVVPTITCYLACHFGKYEKSIVGVNFVVWAICILAKMPWMQGVRILGINRTQGIDDEKKEE